MKIKGDLNMKRSKKFISILLLGMLIFSSISCGSEEEKTKDGYAKTIYLYNWSEYMPKKVLDKIFFSKLI